MSQTDPATAEDTAALAALANGIVPADERDAGAAAVNAGPRLAEKIASGVNAALYRQGLIRAGSLAQVRFGRTAAALDPGQVQELLGELREQMPVFFRQLRTDVCALYLSDPGVWARIGFPGPSTATGGYPDFDQPQSMAHRPERNHNQAAPPLDAPSGQ
jgi:hypothetical protein